MLHLLTHFKTIFLIHDTIVTGHFAVFHWNELATQSQLFETRKKFEYCYVWLNRCHWHKFSELIWNTKSTFTIKLFIAFFKLKYDWIIILRFFAFFRYNKHNLRLLDLVFFTSNHFTNPVEQNNIFVCVASFQNISQFPHR